METPDTSGTRALKIGDIAPDFSARTTRGDLRLSDHRGHWVVLFSHPADFTPVCTSEFVALALAAPRFDALDCALIGLSVDSLYSHHAWLRAIRENFDVAVPFPVIEDPSMAIGRAYCMIDDAATDAATVRATYFIDPEGVIRAITWYPMTIGRSVEEMVRMVTALKRTYAGDVLTPVGWLPGDAVLLPPMLTDDSTADWFHLTRPDR